MKSTRLVRMLVCCAAGLAVLALYASAAEATQAAFKTMRKLEKRERTPHADQLLKRPKYKYTATGERDPFESLITRDEKKGTVKVSREVEVPPPQLTVQGVIWGGKFPQAIVNDQLVKVGDELTEEVVITRIDAAGVSFEFNEKEYSVPAPAIRDSAQSE